MLLQGTVVGVRPYGCFVAFDVEAVPASEGESGPGAASGPQAGLTLEVYGMVHLSEIAWDFVKDARLAVKVGCKAQTTLQAQHQLLL